MTPDRAAKWAATRAQGRWPFVWRAGVLQWGLLMFGIMGGMQLAQYPSRWVFVLALNLPLWLLGGFFFGLSTWHFSERSYAKHLKKSQSTDARAL